MAQAKFRVLDQPEIFQCYWIFSLKFFDIHSIYTVYVMHIKKINWGILDIYNVYPIQIFLIFSLKFFDVHGICMVYVMHIQKN